MKILLLGKDGQVGQECQRNLSSLGDVTALGHGEIDLANLHDLSTLLTIAAPDVIVNAAAYTAVDKAEADELAAHKVNAAAVGVMAAYARAKGKLLVHYSTDYVFDGEKATPYLEADSADPQSAYGRSKYAGEQVILESACNALIFRTSWVFSTHGNNFVKTILRLARERESLNVVSDQVGAPTSARLIAAVTALAIAAYHAQTLKSGIYHLTAAGETSWHGLARHTVSRAHAKGVALKLNPGQINAVSTEAYPLPARRPHNSRLDTKLLSRALNLSFPAWEDDVDQVIDHLLRSEPPA
jgi:dTDP-4-dehydrorhamnose reductase